MAIFDRGTQRRVFKSLLLMCELLHLDKKVVGAYLRERGYWCGMDFTVFSAMVETRGRNLGKY